MKIHSLKAFSDNYIWIIEEGKNVLVVDPGEARGVLSYLEENQLELTAILLTHKHDDHIGGVKEILAKYTEAPVYGPIETASLNDFTLQNGDTFELLGQTFQVFKTAGHTEDHISFLMGESLFCGDALFSGGCGRVFTGDYQAQFDALQVFKTFADEVKVYAGHEYTQTNLRFAHSMDPSHEAVATALEEVDQLRSQNLSTLPTSIAKEKDINLFLQAGTLAEFIELREARDEF